MSKKTPVSLADYANLLGRIKARIRQAQARAVLAANAEMVRLYWDVGRMLDERQEHEGWGAAVIPRLARDLHNELPEIKGFSERNLKRMLRFYRSYPAPESIVPRAVAQLPPDEPLVWSIPWGHQSVLLEKVKDLDVRVWYMEQTLRNGWSRDILTLMIKGDAHARQGRAVSNFPDRLPLAQSDLVTQTLKDPYIFDFMTLEGPFHERELETGLLHHIERFLLELGQGFAFVGRQYHIEIGDEDFYIDLLFYHLRLRAFVVVDLKKGPFKAEYAGKMNLYLSLVDDRLRHATDSPSIGLILCQDRNRIVAEYALRGMTKPIGVSEYQLTRSLPHELRSSLPTIEAIEAELAEPGPGESGREAARAKQTDASGRKSGARARRKRE